MGSRCFNNDYLPQTYISIKNDIVVGMNEIVMNDDVGIRLDYYPWLVNVYVREDYRGCGICSLLMHHAKETFEKLEIHRIYLHSKHIGLYEKYGWKFLEEVTAFKDDIKNLLFRYIIFDFDGFNLHYNVV